MRKGVIQSLFVLAVLGAPLAAASPRVAPPYAGPAEARNVARTVYTIEVVASNAAFDVPDSRIAECDYPARVIRFLARLETDPRWYVLRDVLTHEVGHALGLNHEDAKDAPSIMGPSIEPSPLHWPSKNELAVYRNRQPLRWITLDVSSLRDRPRSRRACEWAAALWNQAGDRDAVEVRR